MVSLALSCSSTSQLLPSPPNFSVKPPRFSTHRFPISCKATSGNKNDITPDDPNIETSQSGKVDRRNLLLGVGGLYGAAKTAFATPIASPDLSKCSTGTNLNTQQPLDISCCLPISPEIIDYKLPPVTKMRVRPAAHLAGRDYYAKYEKALALMKALPPDDPRSFMQQANVHCAYCNLIYQQLPAGDSNLKLQIHNCWHFYPWHRWYLYFYERILGKLIDDPTFGLPFWNWDHPDGMIMPGEFARKDSPLFDARRNQDHLPPALADLAYSARSATKPEKIVSNNLTVMYTEMVRNGSKLEDFYGAKYVVGTSPDPVGENTPTGEDMGNFYSTGREPLFYSHHANIDRLWSIWRGLRGSKPKDFPDSDWLEADYVFYDENARLVRVKNVDTLDNEKMGYIYQDVDIPWLKNRPRPRFRKSKVAASSAGAGVVFPVRLDKVVKVLVDRPKKSRSKKDKEKEEELLVIEGIEIDTATFVKFDVFVNDEDDKPDELDKAEYAGCYSQVPHKNSTKVKTKIRLGLTELLEDLDVEDDDKILVSLVPKAGGEDITIGGIKIIYAS
ncbi:polyphenol oxidase ii chloroplastic [Phtheirospermum japonicum]|uniref:Polyphenol oxidase ii chloroplastic n=1 Tax=Phtheirospermum japonicum TaxID=374723 RepID=A0A830B0E0_9LAMI|nr:polyphenol oxidase ii chloroplastic [Phtheirospermum japonicum]